MQIIQQIKKNKGKNIIVNNTKNKENKGKNNVEQTKNSNDIYDNSLKYNSKSNNYIESEGGSMVQQFSQGTDEREKYDMFD